MKNLLIKIIAFISLFYFSDIMFAQEYVSVIASAQKKEFLLSEKIKINLKASIQEGLHINANKIDDEDLIPTSVKITNPDFKLSGVSWPVAKSYKFAFSETELKVFEGTVNIGLVLKTGKNVKPGKYEILGAVHYQACNDRSCFAPKDAKFSLMVLIKEDSVMIQDSVKAVDTNVVKKESSDSSEIKSVLNDTGKNKNQQERQDTVSQTLTATDNQISGYLKEKGFIITFFLIFLGGLALNLTPCVYPLIPITISFFGGKEDRSKGQKVIMAVVYVLGMSVTYSVLGLIAALTGGLFGSMLQNPIVVGVIVAILLLLALSMFGLFEITIPQSIASFSGKSRTGYIGTALMGLTVGFIAAPCIGPFVLSLLVYVGQIGNAFIGFLMFFILSLGLGLPYIFLALFSGSISKLPKSGDWMIGVKIIFGFIMLGLALYTAQPLMSAKIYEIAFPLYLIFAGIFLILFDKKALNSKVYTKIKYTVAIAGIIWGSLNVEFGEAHVSTGKVEWQNLTTLKDIEISINKSTKPTMIDFYADWCAQCKELDKYTYTDVTIIEKSSKFNCIKIDLTKENKEITDKFKTPGLPVVAFINPDGREKTDLRVTGFLSPAEFGVIMDKALK